MFESIQNLLDKMRPKIQGRNKRFSSRFRTSDVLQEASIQLIGEDRRQADDVEPPQVWLDLIGQGTASNLRRRHSANKRTCFRDQELKDVVDVNAGQPCPSEIASTKELVEKIAKCLIGLGPQDQEIFDRHVSGQESFNSIATQMDLPSHQVRRRFKNVLAQIKSYLDDKPCE